MCIFWSSSGSGFWIRIKFLVRTNTVLRERSYGDRMEQMALFLPSCLCTEKENTVLVENAEEERTFPSCQRSWHQAGEEDPPFVKCCHLARRSSFEEAVVSSRSDVGAKVSPSRSPARKRSCQPEQPSGLRGRRRRPATT